ncbi:hypothetical protein ACMYYO_01295 [Dermacoccaceae bacterium W4C1]
MTRRWIVVTLLGAVAFGLAALGVSLASARPADEKITQPGPTVVIGLPEMSWDQVSARSTPNLWGLVEQGAVGNVVTRSISAHSCSQHSWLSISAGARATWAKGPDQTPPNGTVGACPTPPKVTPTGTGARFSWWPHWRTASLARPIAADLGTLASTLNNHGQCVAAVGPLAAWGAADRAGNVDRYSATVAGADFNACPVTLVHLSSGTDADLGDVLERLPKNSTVLVTGLADDTSPEQLRAVVARGPGIPRGLLTSPATRQPGLIQNTDITGFVLQRVIADPGAVLLEGRRPVVSPEPDPQTAFEHVLGVNDQLRLEHRLVAPFFYSYVALLVIAVAIGVALWRTGPAGPTRARRWLAGLGSFAAAVPVSTFLIGLLPWWKYRPAAFWLTGAVFAVAAVLAIAAWAGPWRRWRAGPAAFLAAITAGALALDVTHGSRLQLLSLMGLQPVFGGRFTGMGNVGYALFASTGLLLAALLGGRWVSRDQPRLAAATVLLIGGAAIFIDGLPIWGADAGGPLALAPAVAYLALNAAGIKVTWQRMLMLLVGAFLLVCALGYLDYLRPPQDRTHIGEFVAGFLEAGNTNLLERNIMLNLRMLNSQWINWLVPVLLVVAVYALVRRESRIGAPLAQLTEQIPLLGHGLAAITICWLIGFGANDSGTAIPPAGLLVIAPLVILLAAARGPALPKDVLRAREHAPATPASPQ